MVANIRNTLSRLADESGQMIERFGGLVLRVSGTQHLYLLGLGWTWFSCTVAGRRLSSRDTCSSFVASAQAVSQALSSGSQALRAAASHPSILGQVNQDVAMPGSDDGPAVSCAPPVRAAEHEDQVALRLQFHNFVDVMDPGESLVVNTGRARLKSRALNPATWATSCGILCGDARFFRTRCDRPECA